MWKAYKHSYAIYLKHKDGQDPTVTAPDPAAFQIGEWEAAHLRKQVEDELVPPPPPEITLDDQITEATRELAVRRKVYPRWAVENKIMADGTKFTHHLSEHRIACMLAIVATLKRIKLKS